MDDTPRCPYCGDRMALHILPHTAEQEPYSAWYQCVVCESTSPRLEFPGGISNEKIEERMSALDLTQASRLIPEADLDELGIIYIEMASYKGFVQRVLWESENEDSIRFNVGSGFQSMARADYGKTWRCWTTRPTKEEMENMPWEE